MVKMTFEKEVPTLSVPLWPQGSKQMHLYLPSGATTPSTGVPAVVVFFAGAYRNLLGSGDGTGAWAAAHGMVGIEVEYGTKSTGTAYPENFSDGARAVRLVRDCSQEWGIDPSRVILVGYSAGGHLASLVASTHDHYVSANDDLIRKGISARPDALVLCYPVISFVNGWEPGCMSSSAENFFGKDVLQENERRRFSTEERVTEDLPPTFIWVTRNDDEVPSRHSELFHAACTQARVPCVLIMYEDGPHCLGLAMDRDGDVARWTEMLLTWLRGKGFIAAPT